MKIPFVLQLGIAIPLALGTVTLNTLDNYAFAQLTPDNTLGAENSIVTPQQLRDLIQGGAIRRNALFHSFDEFNVGEGREVFFDLQNNADILSIFTRVTGSNSSSILGTLGVLNDLGNANLFLLNPNGITFGANANLQLNGSFFATTADGFGFDNFTFSASNPEAPPPLLTIRIPRFLSFRDNPRNIAVNRDGILDAPEDTIRGVNQVNLSVNQGQNLSLVGGNVTVEGGQLNAPGGRIELAGMFVAGNVTINEDFSLTFSDVVVPDADSFKLEEANATDTGTVTINADTLNLSNGVQIVSQTENGTELGGITINATDSVNVTNGSQIRVSVNGSSRADGIAVNAPNATVSVDGQLIDNTDSTIARSLILVQAGANSSATANAGNLNINTHTLNVSNRGLIQTLGSGAGSVGEININADEAINFSNFGQLFANALGEGDLGNVAIDSPDITLEGQSGFFIQVGANLNPSNFGLGNNDNETNALATGNVGKLEINTRTLRLFNFDDTNPNLRSRISAQTWGGGNIGENVNGNLVSIIINAGEGVTFDRGQIFAQTRASGEVGDIIINTPNFSLNGNSIIFSRTGLPFLPRRPQLDDDIAADNDFSTGNAGNIILNVGTLNLSHSNPVFRNLDGSKIQSQTFGAGIAGNIIINTTESVSISSDFTDRGPSSQSIITSTFGSTSPPENRTAGNITINTPSLSLDNSRITADTNRGNSNAGTIDINASDLVILRNGSRINVNALDSATGGNIFLDTDLLVAFPDENSDITANATLNSAGRIEITAEGIFGLEVQDQLTDQSDITAFSEQDPSLNGQVIFNTPENNPDEGLRELPESTVEKTDIVSQSVCSDFGGGGQLRNTGRNGMPPTPELAIRSEVVNVDLVDEVLPAPPPEAIKPHHRTDVTFIDSEGEEFKPAMGAVLLPDGMVRFVDYNPAEVYRDMYAAAGCNN